MYLFHAVSSFNSPLLSCPILISFLCSIPSQFFFSQNNLCSSVPPFLSTYFSQRAFFNSHAPTRIFETTQIHIFTQKKKQKKKTKKNKTYPTTKEKRSITHQVKRVLVIEQRVAPPGSPDAVQEGNDNPEVEPIQQKCAEAET